MFKRIIIIHVTFLLFGCSDYLEIEPDSEVNIETLSLENKKDIELALAGLYSHLSSDDLFGKNFILMDYGTDEGYASRNWTEDCPINLFTHNANTLEIENTWRTLYSLINHCNLFISKLDRLSLNETEYNHYLAEIKFLRGIAYYYLTLWWNEVPVRTETVKNQFDNHKKSSQLEMVYNQIVSDLEFSKNHLEDNINNLPTRATKSAAHAFLAKMYLKMAGYPLYSTSYKGENPYQLALNECNSIISSGKHSLNASYKSQFLNYIQNVVVFNESIFEISFNNLLDIGINTSGNLGTRNGLYFSHYEEIDFPISNVFVSPSPILKYLSEDDDLRVSWNIPNIYFYKAIESIENPIKYSGDLKGSYSIGKYRRWEPLYPDDIERSNLEFPHYRLLEDTSSPNINTTGINFPVIRYADILLMYAEASNEINGPNSTAINTLNEVRFRAGLPSIEVAKPETIISKESFFNELVNERLRELCFEGHRKHDLTRWDLLEGKLHFLEQSILTNPNYSSSSLSHQGYLRCVQNFNKSIHMSLPYPAQEVSINNKMNQKEGW